MNKIYHRTSYNNDFSIEHIMCPNISSNGSLNKKNILSWKIIIVYSIPKNLGLMTLIYIILIRKAFQIAFS